MFAFLNMIIGITGTNGAGKTTLVSLLKKRGFKSYSVREFLIEEIKKRKLPVNRNSMIFVANQLRKKNSPSYIVEKLIEKAKKEEGDVVIESIRNPKEAEALQKNNDFYLLAIDANPQLRYSRIILRQSETDNVSFEEFLEQEKKEMNSTSPYKQNLHKCIQMADFKIENNKAIENLEKKLDEILREISKKSQEYTSLFNNKNNLSNQQKKDGFLMNASFLDEGLLNKQELYKKQERAKKREDYLSWDEYFMGVAVLSAMRSKDPFTQVGACIVDEKNHIIATGYNGFPIGCSDDNLPWDREGPLLETKYPYVVHAEANAITNATKDLNGCKIYVPRFPCNECTKLIIQSGIKEVIYIDNKYEDREDYVASKKMLNLAGIKIRQFIPKKREIVLDFFKSTSLKDNIF